jgi:tetratricopeptide (TPR) repeat protein
LRIRHVFAATLAVFLVIANGAGAETRMEEAIQVLQDEWAEAFYRLPEDQQVERYESLLTRVRAIEREHPDRAEPLILQAIILCTYAAAERGLGSLTQVRTARELLVKSIDLDPTAMEASAFITLGNLYYRLPGWPISYGDDDLARQYLEAAARLYPNALDSNYFLGDFWLQEGDYDKALSYLEKADQAPIRTTQHLSDSKIKEQLAVALNAARKRDGTHSDFFSDLLPSSFKQESGAPP